MKYIVSVFKNDTNDLDPMIYGEYSPIKALARIEELIENGFAENLYIKVVQ